MVWKPLVSMTFRLCCKNIRFFTYLCWYCWTIFNVNFPHIFHYGKLMFVREFTKYSSTCKTSSCDISQAPSLKHPTTIPEKNTFEKKSVALLWSEEKMWQKKIERNGKKIGKRKINEETHGTLKRSQCSWNSNYKWKYVKSFIKKRLFYRATVTATICMFTSQWAQAMAAIFLFSSIF